MIDLCHFFNFIFLIYVMVNVNLFFFLLKNNKVVKIFFFFFNLCGLGEQAVTRAYVYCPSLSLE